MSDKLICSNCKKEVKFSDVKYMPSKGSRILLCSKCRGEGEKKPIVPEKEPIDDNSSPKQRYYCSRCRYLFKHDPTGVTNLRCPYCGSNETVKEY